MSRERAWYVGDAVSGWRLRSCGMIAALAAGAAMSGCGSGARQDASEPNGNFLLAASAHWTTSQHLSQHTQLVITATNTGTKTVPDVAVTITDVAGGAEAPAFQKLLHMPGLASQARPVWVVDQAPDPASVSRTCPQNFNPGTYTGSNYSTCSGGPGGAVTAYTNTWALGQLAPGKSVTFNWHVTAVQSGTYVVNWRVAAGLNGKAKAVSASGNAPHGSFTVNVATAPQQAYVNNGGQVVTTR
jgi:hypothetical protein